MTRQALTKLEKKLGVKFKRQDLLRAALTHPSYQNTSRSDQMRIRFQRLEFLGDAILNYFVASRLYDLFPEANEGVLSRLRSILVSRKLLARISHTLQLKSFLLFGEGMNHMTLEIRDKILADAFESVTAAVYFDRGLPATMRFLAARFEPYFDKRKLLRFDPNPKSALQELVQKKFHVLPAYHAEMDQAGSFTAWVTVRGKRKTKGEGRTKQAAEMQAAQKLLKKLKGKRRS